MRFRSTRGTGGEFSFREALLKGLAPDGGLFEPTEEPNLRSLIRGFDQETPFVTIAGEMLSALFPEEYPDRKGMEIAAKAFPFSPELTRLAPGIRLLELFHGPSCAFKDFGASFLATAMEDALLDTERRAVILTATSGDTGSAVAQAFYRRRNIDVVILYPSGRVSPLQEKQLTTLGENILALEVHGSFDDCQRLVKEAFQDPELSGAIPLTSANSINVGRLIPQSFYYIFAFTRLKKKTAGELVFAVPSGNFGNLTAGVFAWRWGMPANAFLAATNENDVVPEFLSSGVYRPRPSIRTLANAMDVGNPSNFERLLRIFESGSLAITSMITGSAVTDQEIASTMRRYYEEQGAFLCPHTAAGVYASEKFARREMASQGIVAALATAHPAKFIEVFDDHVGRRPQIPERLARHLEMEKVSVEIESSLDALRSQLISRYAG
ncbi:MAG: threonine synthase [Alkalispirochaetaceae bacterium]